MEVRKCTRCGLVKDVSQFTKNSSKKDGIALRCRECTREIGREGYRRRTAEVSAKRKQERLLWSKGKKERITEYNREYCKRNRFKIALSNCRLSSRSHGYECCISTEREISTAFTGRCDICGIHEGECAKKLHMDHDHDTGAFRGWLCHRCNFAVGLLRDSPDVALALALYLEKQQEGE